MSGLTRRSLLRLTARIPFLQLSSANAVPPRAKRVRQLPEETHTILSVAWSADGKRIAIGDFNKLKVFDGITGKLVWKLDDIPNNVKAIAWSTDGKTIAYGCANNKCYLVSAVDGKLMRTFEGHTDTVVSLAFGAGDAKLLMGSEDKTVSVWDVASARNIAFASVCDDNLNSVAFHQMASSALLAEATTTSASTNYRR